MAFLCAHIADPRFADYSKVELVFSEGPEKIPGRLLTVLFWASVFPFELCWRERELETQTGFVSPFSPHAALLLPLCPLVRRDVECCRVEM